MGRALELVRPGGRALLGIAGPPGAGKSTLARRLVEALGPRSALVPMDGFHLAQVELERLRRAGRKGAQDTFDALGYLALLARLTAEREQTVYAPAFSRELEEPIAGAIPVGPEVDLVVTEGNYLLVPTPPWAGLRELLDQVWYLELAEPLRLARLVRRHLAYGRSLEEARRWALGSDQANARLVAASRERADLVVGGGFAGPEPSP